MWSELQTDFLAVKNGKPAHNTVFPVVIYAWAQFGNTAHLVPKIFSLLTWDNPSDVDVWVKQVAPAFSYALQKYASRFSESTHGQIKSYTVPYKSAKAKGEVGIVERKPAPSLKDFAQRFIDAIQVRCAEKPATVAFYAEKLSHLLGFEPLASARLDKIDEALIESYVQHRSKQKGRRNDELAPATVNRASNASPPAPTFL